jgi:hypothetical protein
MDLMNAMANRMSWVLAKGVDGEVRPDVGS